MTDEKKVILVIGKRGCGKSYLVKKMIAAERRLFVWDLMSEYNLGVTFGPENMREFTWFWQKFYKRDFRIVYRPIRPQAEIVQIADLVYELGGLTFVVEEIDAICTSYSMPEEFSSIIQRGRHKDIRLIGVTPAPFGIHRDLTRQAKEIYVFNTNEPKDITYLKDLLGSEIESKIAALELYQYVKWTDGGGFEIGKA